MRRRVVDVKPEPRRFRHEAIQRDVKPDNGLRVSVGETALAKQIQRLDAEQHRKRAAH